MWERRDGKRDSSYGYLDADVGPGTFLFDFWTIGVVPVKCRG